MRDWMRWTRARDVIAGRVERSFDSSCRVLFSKIFPFPLDPNQIYINCRPVPLEGRLAIVTDAGRDAVDAGSVRRDT